VKFVLSTRFALFLSFFLVFQSANQIIFVAPILNAHAVTRNLSDVNLSPEYQNITTRYGDLIIGNTTVYQIRDCEFNLTGRLTITDKALVTIKDATILLTCLTDRWNWESGETDSTGPFRAFMIIVEEQARLEVDNATFALSAPRLDPEIPRVFGVQYHGIHAKDSAKIYMSDSRLLYTDGLGDFIYSTDNSRIQIVDSDLSTHQYVELHKTIGTPTPGSGTVLVGNSNVYVENCLFDVAYFGDNSTVTLFDVNITELFSHDPSDTCTINVTDSRIGQIRLWAPANVYLNNVIVDTLNARINCSIWATKCTFGGVYAAFGADVWLSDTEVQEIGTYEKGNVWIVYSLPLFGQITISYIYAPYVIPLILTTVIIVTLVLVYFVLRRRSKFNSQTSTKTPTQCVPQIINAANAHSKPVGWPRGSPPTPLHEGASDKFYSPIRHHMYTGGTISLRIRRQKANKS